jgi:hypothetical protein
MIGWINMMEHVDGVRIKREVMRNHSFESSLWRCDAGVKHSVCREIGEWYVFRHYHVCTHVLIIIIHSI